MGGDSDRASLGMKMSSVTAVTDDTRSSLRTKPTQSAGSRSPSPPRSHAKRMHLNRLAQAAEQQRVSSPNASSDEPTAAISVGSSAGAESLSDVSSAAPASAAAAFVQPLAGTAVAPVGHPQANASQPETSLLESMRELSLDDGDLSVTAPLPAQTDVPPSLTKKVSTHTWIVLADALEEDTSPPPPIVRDAQRLPAATDQADGGGSLTTDGESGEIDLLHDLSIDTIAQLHNHQNWTPFVKKRQQSGGSDSAIRSGQSSAWQTPRGAPPSNDRSRLRALEQELAALTPMRPSEQSRYNLLHSPIAASSSAFHTPYSARKPRQSRAHASSPPAQEQASPECPFVQPTEAECEEYFGTRPSDPHLSPKGPRLYDPDTDTVLQPPPAASATNHDNHDDSFYASQTSVASPSSPPRVPRLANSHLEQLLPSASSDVGTPKAETPTQAKAKASFTFSPLPTVESDAVKHAESNALPFQTPSKAALQQPQPGPASILKTPLFRSAAASRSASKASASLPQRPVASSSNPFLLSPIPTFGTQRAFTIGTRATDDVPSIPPKTVRFDVPHNSSSSQNSSFASSFGGTAHQASFTAASAPLQEISVFEASLLELTQAQGFPDGRQAVGLSQTLNSFFAPLEKFGRSTMGADTQQRSGSPPNSSAAPVAPFQIVVDASAAIGQLDSTGQTAPSEFSFRSSSSDGSFAAATNRSPAPTALGSTLLEVPSSSKSSRRKHASRSSSLPPPHRVPIKRAHTNSARTLRTRARYHRKSRDPATGKKRRSMRIFPSSANEANRTLTFDSSNSSNEAFGHVSFATDGSFDRSAQSDQVAWPAAPSPILPRSTKAVPSPFVPSQRPLDFSVHEPQAHASSINLSETFEQWTVLAQSPSQFDRRARPTPQSSSHQQHQHASSSIVRTAAAPMHSFPTTFAFSPLTNAAPMRQPPRPPSLASVHFTAQSPPLASPFSRPSAPSPQQMSFRTANGFQQPGARDPFSPVAPAATSPSASFVAPPPTPFHPSSPLLEHPGAMVPPAAPPTSGLVLVPVWISVPAASVLPQASAPAFHTPLLMTPFIAPPVASFSSSPSVYHKSGAMHQAPAAPPPYWPPSAAPLSPAYVPSPTLAMARHRLCAALANSTTAPTLPPYLRTR